MAAVQFSLAQTWTIFGNNSRRAKKNVTFFSRSSEFFPFSSRRFFNVFPFPLFSLIVYLSSILFFWCWSESTWREKTCQPIATKVLDRLLLIPFLALHSNTQTLNKHLKTSIQLHSLCLTWPRLLCCLVLTKKFTLQKSSIVSKQDFSYSLFQISSAFMAFHVPTFCVIFCKVPSLRTFIAKSVAITSKILLQCWPSMKSENQHLLEVSSSLPEHLRT